MRAVRDTEWLRPSLPEKQKSRADALEEISAPPDVAMEIGVGSAQPISA
jgi:hypothetical protein